MEALPSIGDPFRAAVASLIVSRCTNFLGTRELKQPRVTDTPTCALVPNGPERWALSYLVRGKPPSMPCWQANQAKDKVIY